MRIILLAGTILAISACSGGNKSANSQANTMTTTNTITTDTMSMNGAMPMDQNSALTPMPGAANGMTDSETRNLMMKDRNTNDPDTNLANGL